MARMTTTRQPVACAPCYTSQQERCVFDIQLMAGQCYTQRCGGVRQTAVSVIHPSVSCPRNGAALIRTTPQLVTSRAEVPQATNGSLKTCMGDWWTGMRSLRASSRTDREFARAYPRDSTRKNKSPKHPYREIFIKEQIPEDTTTCKANYGSDTHH